MPARGPRPRFIVRWLMVAVVLVAASTAGSMEVGKWLHYHTTLREYERAQASYTLEGRVTLGHCVEKSRRLMDASLAMCLTRKGKAATILAHIERIGRLLEAERSEPEVVHGGPDLVDIAEAQLSLSESETLRKRLGCEP